MFYFFSRHFFQAYSDNGESNMRKECLYALIYTTISVGEVEMAPYLLPLPPSKVPLLRTSLCQTHSVLWPGYLLRRKRCVFLMK